MRFTCKVTVRKSIDVSDTGLHINPTDQPNRVEKDLVVIFGPPAVGKMTVGRALEKITGYRLFHNHMSIDLALNFFGYEDEAYRPMVEGIREVVFKQFLNGNGKGLIFTFVWDLEDDYGFNYFDCLAELGYRVHLVELKATISALVVRNRSEKRLAEKPTKVNVVASEKNLMDWMSSKKLNTNWNDALHKRFEKYLYINNTHMAPEATAATIMDKFDFEVVDEI
ncbi:MAG: AAA family ATPase [Algicola sp.]|nr:AAA family ATPase [Algicola sp.]